MPEKLERYVKAIMATGKTEDAARAICKAQFSDKLAGHFRDSMVYDPQQKTAISVRDGVIEYLGAEIGMQPGDRLFTVYRSPATIANAAMRMQGIPITSDHVSLDIPAPTDGGFVDAAEMVDTIDPTTSTTIAIRNRLTLADTLAAMVNAGKRELSLGYGADLVPHDEFDFEQIDIRPHHLAAVDRGRCGPMCSFIDRKPVTTSQGDKTMATKNPRLHRAFCDAEGSMNLQQIIELATALPEAIKSVPVEQLQALVGPLQAIVAAAKAVVPETAAEGTGEEAAGEQMTDEEAAAAKQDDEKKFSDAVNAAVRKQQVATDAAIKVHTSVMEKARGFLPETYSFADKATVQIMRDVLAAEHPGEKFSDADLPMAFKLLKKTESKYQTFGDKNPNDFSALADKEL
jgi:hypothetical protein